MSASLAADVARDWNLRLGEPYPPGAASGYVARAELPDGTPAVLKLGLPHRESEQEADALERWNGDGAVRLLARDDDRHALLLERGEPGTRAAGRRPRSARRPDRIAATPLEGRKRLPHGRGRGRVVGAGRRCR